MKTCARYRSLLFLEERRVYFAYTPDVLKDELLGLGENIFHASDEPAIVVDVDKSKSRLM